MSDDKKVIQITKITGEKIKNGNITRALHAMNNLKQKIITTTAVPQQNVSDVTPTKDTNTK